MYTLHNAGYGKHSNKLKDILISEFDTDVQIILSADQGKTGNFEVTIENTGELIHSKTQNGHGRCETSAEQQAVIDKIQAYIDSCE
jgi:selT/selW/selH-like putative selenoprotein